MASSLSVESRTSMTPPCTSYSGGVTRRFNSLLDASNNEWHIVTRPEALAAPAAARFPAQHPFDVTRGAAATVLHHAAQLAHQPRQHRQTSQRLIQDSGSLAGTGPRSSPLVCTKPAIPIRTRCCPKAHDTNHRQMHQDPHRLAGRRRVLSG